VIRYDGAMTIQQLDQDGIHAATQELSAGRAVVLPCPAPLPYAVVGTRAARVNAAKGRFADQPVGMAITDPTELRRYITLDPESRQFAEWASRVRKLNLLVPVTDTVPDWALPSVSTGWAALTLAWLPELRPLLDRFGHLYLSSANRTKHAVTTTAHAADVEFRGELLVLDGGRLRDPRIKSGSAAIVRFDRHLSTQIHRSGINMDGWPDATSYLSGLKRDWQASPTSKQCQVGSNYTKQYSAEFKRDAVAPVDSSGRTVTEVTRELGVSPESLRNWYQQARAGRGEGQPGELTSAEREEFKRLRELASEQEKTIEVLRKAAVFFAKERSMSDVYAFIEAEKTTHGAAFLCRLLNVPAPPSTPG
jgi:transposase